MTVIPELNGFSSGNFPTWPVDISRPTGVNAGDLMLLSFVSSSALGAITPPTGWSQTSLGSFSGTGLFMQVWWRLAGGSEPLTYHWLAANNTVPAQWIFATYSGVSQSTPIDVAWQTATGTTTPDNCPAITTVTDGCAILSWLAAVNNISWTAPVTSPVTAVRLNTGGGQELFDSIPYNHGTIAARTFTPSGTSGRWLAATIAIRPSGTVVHSGLTGTGSVAVSSPPAVQITMTGIPAGIGQGKGNPPRYFDLGNIAWGTGNGALRNWYLEHSTELVIAPISDASVIYYSFAPGVTGSITELTSP